MSVASNMRQRKVDPLSKKVPQNPKYRDVQPIVDSGSSMNKYLKKIEEIRTNYKYKPNELFKRMKLTTFVQLIIQVSSIDEDTLFEENDEELTDKTRPSTVSSELRELESARTDQGDKADQPSTNGTNGNPQASSRASTRSTLHGLITGHGEHDALDKKNGEDNSNRLDPNLLERPFLLLDVREKEEYDQCRIISAQSFPVALLSRSCNYETKDMLAYKNHPGKIIIVYDEDERLAPKSATTLVERGYDNLFLLSGGLKLAVKLYPRGLITGTPPPSIAITKPLSIAPPDRDSFTKEDVWALLDQTEAAVKDPSANSRLSRASTLSSRTSTSKPPGTARSDISVLSNSGSVIHRKPFR